MSGAQKLSRVSIEDYLDSESISPIKHEYLGGEVYPMAAARNAHNLITANTMVALGSRLRGRSCRPYASDTKLRVRLPSQVRFYYPDVPVICRPNPQTDAFQDEPAVLFEVLSRRTRRIDTGEKKDAYLTIPSLHAYVLVEQEKPELLVYRRTESGFIKEVYEGLDKVLPLPEIGLDLPLAEIYEAVEFLPEKEEAEIG